MKSRTKRRLTVTAIILAAVIAVYAIIALIPRPDNFKGENPMMKDSDMPILIAHGGGNKEFPDNTLEAFYNAYDADPRVMMETDVSITKDGVVILSHDTTIDRKTDKTGKIADWNYSDLIAQRVNFGYTNDTEDGVLVGEREIFKNRDGVAVKPTDVPNYENAEGLKTRDSEVYLATTLEELIVSFPENRINVEIKQSGELGIKAAEAVIDLLEKHGAFDRVVLASFHPEIYNTFKDWQKSGAVPDSFMYSPGTNGAIKYYVLYLLGLDVFFRDGMCVFQLPTEEYGFKLATARLVKNAHKHNLAVHFWTINDPDEMRMLIEIEADGIMTDYPHRLKDVYAKYKD